MHLVTIERTKGQVGKMSVLTWGHGYLVGVRSMDCQHGILMDTLNELRLALVQGADRAEVSADLNRLVDFTHRHFESEEKLMEQHQFPGLLEHRAAHDGLLETITRTAQHAQHVERVDLHSVLATLRHCYLDHIEELDRKYAGWFNERGIY